ncbi:MAG: DMT family transporter [Flavobacteriales bacterium]|nr:DMT family transporter [Flavobacteriales bacterium]
MDNNKSVFFWAAIIGSAAILWGFDGVVLTPRLYNLDITFVVFILHFIPFALMNIFLYKKYSLIKTLNRVELMSMIFIALFGGVIGTLSIVKALFLVNFHALSIVVLLQKLQPIFAIFLAVTFLKERLRKRYIFWAGVALASGYFLTFGLDKPIFDLSNDTFKASLFAILAAFSFGSSTVFGKKVMYKLDFAATTFFRYGLTSFIMFFVVAANSTFKGFVEATSENWIVIVLISLTTGSGSMMLYYFGLKHVKAIIATIMEQFFPISAVFFDYFINGNILSPVQVTSAVVMIFAIINLNTDNARALSKLKIKIRNKKRK